MIYSLSVVIEVAAEPAYLLSQVCSAMLQFGRDVSWACSGGVLLGCPWGQDCGGHKGTIFRLIGPCSAGVLVFPFHSPR